MQRNLPLLGAGFALAAALPAQNLANAVNYGSGCPTGSAVYEQFTGSGTGDLAGTALTFSPAAGGFGVSAAGSFNTGFTNNISAGDDSLTTGLQLGFTMPFGNTLISEISIDSNGQIGLGPGALSTSDFSESTAEFLNGGIRICGWWDDLNPTAGGGVYFDATPTMAMVTWDSVPQFANTDVNTFQIQLFATGDIVMVWNAGCTDDAIAGISFGNGAADPGATDLSALAPGSVSLGGVPVGLTSTLPILGSNVDLTVRNAAGPTVINFGLQQLNVQLRALPGCTVLANQDFFVPAVNTTPDTASLTLPVPPSPTIAGVSLYSQAVVVNPAIGNVLNAGLSNGTELLLGEAPVRIVTEGPNSFNDDTTQGYFRVTNFNTDPMKAITSVTFDYSVNLPSLVFDTDQTGMADEFINGNSTVGTGCNGTYRNMSDVACGLDYAAPQINLAAASCQASPSENSGAEATNQTVTNSFNTLTWRFTGGTFLNGATFEFDADTDGGGISGDANAGMVVIVTFADGSMRMGTLAADGFQRASAIL